MLIYKQYVLYICIINRSVHPYLLYIIFEINMVDMNVKNVYKEEWYESVSVNEIDSASVVKEMIDIRDGSIKCEIFNIDDVEFIINDLCIN